MIPLLIVLAMGGFTVWLLFPDFASHPELAHFAWTVAVGLFGIFAMWTMVLVWQIAYKLDVL